MFPPGVSADGKPCVCLLLSATVENGNNEKDLGRRCGFGCNVGGSYGNAGACQS